MITGNGSFRFLKKIRQLMAVWKDGCRDEERWQLSDVTAETEKGNCS